MQGVSIAQGLLVAGLRVFHFLRGRSYRVLKTVPFLIHAAG